MSWSKSRLWSKGLGNYLQLYPQTFCLSKSVNDVIVFQRIKSYDLMLFEALSKQSITHDVKGISSYLHFEANL